MNGNKEIFFAELMIGGFFPHRPIKYQHRPRHIKDVYFICAIERTMVPNDDIFGCFGNTTFENAMACFFPCYTYGTLIKIYNSHADATMPQAECNYCTSMMAYCCCCCAPCLPGTYLRILRREEAITGCLSYSFLSCCALLQDKRRIDRESASYHE
jgi:hypothetical protein